MAKALFDQSKPWLKGNLHAHTTASDGVLAPEEAAALFKKAGYDFICITDHRKLGLGAAGGGFIVIPGAEYDFVDPETRTAWHITAINQQRAFDCSGLNPGQIIGAIHDAGGMAVLAHPAWSLMSHEQVAALTDIDAIEVYNGISDAYCGRGDSSSYVDVLGSTGFARPLLAVDDCHFYDKDVFTGFTMVNTDDFTPEGIVTAIKQGRSYASQGPLIGGISIDNGVVSADFSPLRRVCFLSDSFWSRLRVVDGTADAPVTRAQYSLLPGDSWIRIVGEDFAGKLCWSNIVDIGGGQ